MTDRRIYILMAAILAAAAGGCKSETTPSDDGGKIKYPYRASIERRDQIINGARRLTAGMTDKDVLQQMGEPDERNQLYLSAEHFEDRKVDGWMWIYLLEREQPYGGIMQRKEKSFRIEINLDGKVKRIEAEGMTANPSRRKSR